MAQERLRPLIAAMASVYRPRPDRAGEARNLPFITISRQAGAGASTVKQSLVEHLSRCDHADPPWAGYDRELVEQVAHNHHIDPRRIDQLEDETPSWLLEVFEGLAYNDTEPDPTDRQVYHMVTDTMRKLARRGRVILVGRGGAEVTQDLPNAVHVRLVAPLKHRIDNLAAEQGLTQEQAAREVERLDEARARFFKRFWDLDEPGPERFDLTLNTARMSEAEIVEAIVPMIRTLGTEASESDDPTH